MELVTPHFGLLFLLIIFAIAFILPIIALVDILKSEFKNNDKLIWTVVVIFLSVIGAILYFTIGRNQRIQQ
jgi:nitrate reductase gamma subunit